MRKKVRRILAFLLALAVAMSVMTGMALSAPAESEPEATPAAADVAVEEKQTDATDSTNQAEPEEDADKDAPAEEDSSEDGEAPVEGDPEEPEKDDAAEPAPDSQSKETSEEQTGESKVAVMSAAPAAAPVKPLADIDPDANFILVGKKFVGIEEGEIPGNFQITVTPRAGGTSYTLNKGNVTVKSADGLTWQWQISNVGVGTYTVTESGENIDGYTVSTTGTGASVEVKAADFDVTYTKETTCSHTNWPVKIDGDQNVLFAAALTGGEGCIVISKEPLNEGQRATVTKAVTGIGGNWENPVYFYSIAKNGYGPYTIAGRELRYDPNTQEVILSATSDWTHVATVQYSITEASNPDINIINSYTPLERTVTLKKLVTGNMGDPNKEFTFSASSNATLADTTLKHKETTTITAKVGDTVTITEGECAGYTTTAEGTADITDGTYTEGTRTYSFVMGKEMNENTVVTFTNNKTISPPTGLTDNAVPYMVMVGIAAAAGVSYVLVRRRRDSE